ncbi:MAG: glycosyltransferase family 4 protein [Desulfobacterales bacterium]
MKQTTHRVLLLCPFGVYPPRSGGHRAILESARYLANSGIDVALYSYGLRRFEALRHFRSFRRVIEPGLTEYRHVSFWIWVDFLRRGRRGLPPLYAAEYVRRSRDEILYRLASEADILLCESPWFFPLRPPDKPVMFVAHNVELDLAGRNMRLTAEARKAIREMESLAWRESDTAICLTAEDRERMESLYGTRRSHILPIGVDTRSMKPGHPARREEIRRRLGVEGKFVVLFTASWHPPNREALKRIEAWARLCDDPDILWVAAGSVGNRARSHARFLQTGPLTDLSDWFLAADCAVNPLLEGSGMNVKMLHCLAYGLPVVTTPFGARGLPVQNGAEAMVVPLERFVGAVKDLKQNESLRARIGERARNWVVTRYSWDVVGRKKRDLLLSMLRPRPDNGPKVPAF